MAPLLRPPSMLRGAGPTSGLAAPWRAHRRWTCSRASPAAAGLSSSLALAVARAPVQEPRPRVAGAGKERAAAHQQNGRSTGIGRPRPRLAVEASTGMAAAHTAGDEAAEMQDYLAKVAECNDGEVRLMLLSLAYAPNCLHAFTSYIICDVKKALLFCLTPVLSTWPKLKKQGLLRTMCQLTVAGEVVGYLEPDMAEHLTKRFPSTFEEVGSGSRRKCVALHSSLSSVNARTEAVASAMAALRADGRITGWRNELYPVASAFNAPPLFLVERAAAPHLGIKAYGVHVSGWVRDPASGEQLLWVARRSDSKPTWPGLLDHIVAGGQVQAISLGDGSLVPRAQ